MKIFKNFKEAGFTLAEVMVTVGILSILTLAVINQTHVANNVTRTSNEDAIITYLTDRISVELSKQSTCDANFPNRDLSSPTNFTNITAADGSILVTSTAPNNVYGKKVGGSNVAASDVNIVQVTQMSTQTNVSNPNQMDISIQFKRRSTSIGNVFSFPKTVVIPVTIVRDPNATSKVLHCFNDITNAISSAIRLSCQGTADYYDSTPTATNPWGTCKHESDTINCGPNKAISKIEYNSGNNGVHKLSYTCTAMNPSTSCAAGQVVVGFNANGTAKCDYPLPNCNAGQILIKQGSQYVCLNTDSGCTGMFAIQKFTGTGVICAPFYPAQTCAGFVQSVGPGTKTCAATVKAVICPAGQYVSSFDGAGNPTCSTYLKPNQSCAAGYGAYAVDSSGTLLCQRLTRKLTCGGSHTYYDCTSAGGYVVNYGSATNSNCHFNGGTCPGGWSQCPTYAATNSASCQDSDSNCSYSAKTTKTANASAFNSPVSPYTVQCGYWARNSGPWVRSCTYYATSGPTATNSRTEIGCY